MRGKMTALTLAAACLSVAPAMAQPWVGHKVIYDAPTTVNMGGREVVADIALHADINAAAKGVTRIALVTDVTKFIVDVEKDLAKWIAAHQDRCGERWAAGKPVIDFPDGAIRFAVDIEVEVWTCGLNGAGEPKRLTREGGDVDVTLLPYVEDGKLQARINAFTIKNRSGVSRYLPLELVVRRLLDDEMAKLNKNPKFYPAPKPFISEGFGYESIRGVKKGDRTIIVARYRGKGAANAYSRLAARVKAEGIEAEGVKKDGAKTEAAAK
jgi:hypothetical protein